MYFETESTDAASQLVSFTSHDITANPPQKVQKVVKDIAFALSSTLRPKQIGRQGYHKRATVHRGSPQSPIYTPLALSCVLCSYMGTRRGPHLNSYPLCKVKKEQRRQNKTRVELSSIVQRTPKCVQKMRKFHHLASMHSRGTPRDISLPISLSLISSCSECQIISLMKQNVL